MFSPCFFGWTQSYRKAQSQCKRFLPQVPFRLKCAGLSRQDSHVSQGNALFYRPHTPVPIPEILQPGPHPLWLSEIWKPLLPTWGLPLYVIRRKRALTKNVLETLCVRNEIQLVSRAVIFKPGSWEP